MKTCFPLFFLLLGWTMLSAQETSAPILFIYDASGSMWGQHDGKTKMEIATQVLGKTVDQLPETQAMGLIAYGHRRKGDCTDVEFLVPSAEGGNTAIKTALKKIKPLGKTPLAYSLSLVIEQLKTKQEKATIILITDGIESCNGDLCQVVREAKAAGIEFKLHIIGFGLKESETLELRCAAKEGEGNYYDADDADALADGLQDATNTTVDSPAANFTAYAVKNGQPVDALIKAYAVKVKRKPILARTYRDTAHALLPPGTYNLEVSVLENSDIKPLMINNIEIQEDAVNHQAISFDGGKLQINVLNNQEGWDAMYKVIDPASGKPVAQGRTYGRVDESEVNAGTYTIEITPTKIEGLETTHRIENVEITGNGIAEVSHNYATGIASIGVQKGGELVDASVNIKDPATGKFITGGRTYTHVKNNPRSFILMPGTYKVEYNTLGKHKGTQSSFQIEIKAGETFEKIIQL